MSYIPLTYFVSRTNIQLPKGLLSENGLTSPMINPLYLDFENQLINDWRSRDNFDRSSIRYEDHLKNLDFSHVNHSSTNIFYNDGITISEVSAPNSYLLPADWSYNPYETINKTIVFIIAVKFISLPNETDTSYGILSISTDGTERHALRFPIYDTNVPAGPKIQSIINGSFKSTGLPHGSGNVFGDIITSESLNKWILIQFYKSSAGTIQFRILGGQWGATYVPEESTQWVDTGYITNRWAYPISPNMVIGMASTALYEELNDAGNSGVNIDDIDWILFEEEHECASYEIDGQYISFECTGEVAFDIKINGIWCNTYGEPLNEFKSNRIFYNTGSHSLIIGKTYTEIRPVLKNTGVLNADNNAILHWVSNDYIAQVGMYAPANWAHWYWIDNLTESGLKPIDVFFLQGQMRIPSGIEDTSKEGLYYTLTAMESLQNLGFKVIPGTRSFTGSITVAPWRHLDITDWWNKDIWDRMAAWVDELTDPPNSYGTETCWENYEPGYVPPDVNIVYGNEFVLDFEHYGIGYPNTTVYPTCIEDITAAMVNFINIIKAKNIILYIAPGYQWTPYIICRVLKNELPPWQMVSLDERCYWRPTTSTLPSNWKTLLDGYRNDTLAASVFYWPGFQHQWTFDNNPLNPEFDEIQPTMSEQNQSYWYYINATRQYFGKYPTIYVDKTSINITTPAGIADSFEITMQNKGGYNLYYTITSSNPERLWLDSSTIDYDGTLMLGTVIWSREWPYINEVLLPFGVFEDIPGVYNETITIDGGADVVPVVINVQITVT